LILLLLIKGELDNDDDGEGSLTSNEDGIGSAADGLQRPENSYYYNYHRQQQQEYMQQQQLLSPKILIMQPILRFLQLLCENHNRDLQVCLNGYIILKPFITNNYTHIILTI
jgi:hypothetical protein